MVWLSLFNGTTMATIELEDGTQFFGRPFGFVKDTVGEIG